jgi:hypothetical protein
MGYWQFCPEFIYQVHAGGSNIMGALYIIVQSWKIRQGELSRNYKTSGRGLPAGYTAHRVFHKEQFGVRIHGRRKTYSSPGRIPAFYQLVEKIG